MGMDHSPALLSECRGAGRLLMTRRRQCTGSKGDTWNAGSGHPPDLSSTNGLLALLGSSRGMHPSYERFLGEQLAGRGSIELGDLTKDNVGTRPSDSLSGEAEDPDRGIAAAALRRD